MHNLIKIYIKLQYIEAVWLKLAQFAADHTV